MKQQQRRYKKGDCEVEEQQEQQPYSGGPTPLETASARIKPSSAYHWPSTSTTTAVHPNRNDARHFFSASHHCYSSSTILATNTTMTRSNSGSDSSGNRADQEDNDHREPIWLPAGTLSNSGDEQAAVQNHNSQQPQQQPPLQSPQDANVPCYIANSISQAPPNSPLSGSERSGVGASLKKKKPEAENVGNHNPQTQQQPCFETDENDSKPERSSGSGESDPVSSLTETAPHKEVGSSSASSESEPQTPVTPKPINSGPPGSAEAPPPTASTTQEYVQPPACQKKKSFVAQSHKSNNANKKLYTEKLSAPKELENHRTVAKSLSARPRSSRSLLQNLSQKAESCTPHTNKPRAAKKRRERLLNAETLDGERQPIYCNSSSAAGHKGEGPEDLSSTSPVTKPPRKLKPRSRTYSSHSTCSNSTLSTKSHYHEILGIGVYNNDHGDSFYSRSSKTSSSSFFYRFGWYQAITGVGGFWLACAGFVVSFTLLTFVVTHVATASGASSLLYSMSSAAFEPSGPPLQIVVATRLHNRQATHPLTDDAVRHKVREFAAVCEMADAVQGVLAVDAEDVNLLRQVRNEVEANTRVTMHALPITPWGRFVPALNALIGYAASLEDVDADAILFVSAETSATRRSIQTLVQHMLEYPKSDENPTSGLARLRTSKLAPPPPRLDNSTLVVGARLAGHDYQNRISTEEVATDDASKATNNDNDEAPVEARAVDLNGRTTPWNTLALWNLKKLATTGFLMLSEGYLTSNVEPSYGVEEVVTIALLQQLLGREHAVAKLVPVPGVSWDADFADPERQQWHHSKMESKLSRADRQMKITKLTGVVHHY